MEPIRDNEGFKDAVKNFKKEVKFPSRNQSQKICNPGKLACLYPEQRDTRISNSILLSLRPYIRHAQGIPPYILKRVGLGSSGWIA